MTHPEQEALERHLTLKVLNFWKFTSYCSLKPLWSGMGGSSAGSYLADPTSLIPSHCASIVATSTLRVNVLFVIHVLFIQNTPWIMMLTPLTSPSSPWGTQRRRCWRDPRSSMSWWTTEGPVGSSVQSQCPWRWWKTSFILQVKKAFYTVIFVCVSFIKYPCYHHLTDVHLHIIVFFTCLNINETCLTHPFILIVVLYMKCEESLVKNVTLN